MYQDSIESQDYCSTCGNPLLFPSKPCPNCFKDNKVDTSNYSLYLPIWKFILFNSLTGGFYIIYWFYRNWKFIKINLTPNISPILRTLAMFVPILAIIMDYKCVKRVYLIIQDGKYNRWKIFFVLLASTFFQPSSWVTKEISQGNFSMIPVFWFLCILGTLPFVVFQKDINKYYSK